MKYGKIYLGYEGLYQINTNGDIVSLRDNKGNIRNKIRKPQIDRNGYFRIGLCKKGKQKFYLIHRLVAETFISNPDNYSIVNHLDGVKTNNNINNLEWCTCKRNIQHAYDTGLKEGKSAEHKGSKNPHSRVNENDVKNILICKNKGIKFKEVYKKYQNKITEKGLEQIWYRYNWKHLVVKE